MLNSIKTKRSARHKGLMFVDITVAGNKMNALVDTGASNLFMFKTTAKRLSLGVEKGNEWIKIVNSKEFPTTGMVQGIHRGNPFR